ncbi:hypothetical protein Tco_0590512 [Tanacetum coccineum]
MHNNIMAAENGGALRKFILKGPYTPTIVTTPAVPETEDSPAVLEQTTVETVTNMTPENRVHFESEKEAIHLILTGIGDEIYSTVDACQTAQEMWEAIERLQQGESLNIQDVKTNLFWEFGQFTSHDGETIESYYTRFYKMMNEMIRNNLTVATMQVNLFDILKQYQKEVNELRAERMTKNANPLALVATAQTLQDPYYQSSKSHKSYAPTSKASLLTRSHATTRYKGKEIVKPITPPSELASKEDSDPEQAQKDKDMQKNLALIAKYFKKLYKPTNNNLRTSSNTRNKNVDTTLRYKNDNQTRQFGNQRAVNVVGTRETECRKPKRVKDSTYHKEKMLLCKQAEKGVQLQAEQSDWLANTDEEIDEQELEAHYSYMAKIQEVPNADSGTDAEPLEQDDQNDVGCDVDYDKLEHKLNETLGLLAQKEIDIKEGLKLKAYKISVVNEKHDDLVKQSLLTKSHYEGLVKEKTKVITDLKLKEEKDIDKMISMEKQLKFLNEIVYKRNQSIQTIHMLDPKGPTFNGRPTFTNPRYLKKAQSEKPCLYEIPYDQSDPANRLIPDREETLNLEKESRSKLNKDLVRPYDYTKLNSLYEIFKPTSQEYHEQLAHANKVRKKMWRKSENHLELVDQAWVKHSKDHFRAPTAKDMEILIKTCLMPLALKTQNDSFAFVHELKKEMHADLKYVKSLENEIEELEFDKTEFSNMYDMLLQECVSNDVMCSYLHSLSDLDAHTELQCLYLHKVKECECLAQKLSKQTEFVSKEVYTELLRSFAKLEKHSISLELTLQQCQEQMKNDTVCKEKASNVFLKEREQYFEIQDLKAQLQDKDIAICELKKLIEKCKGKSVETKFDKPFVVQTGVSNAFKTCHFYFSL